MAELLSTEEVKELCSKVSLAQADMVKAIYKWESAKAACRKAGIELKICPTSSMCVAISTRPCST